MACCDKKKPIFVGTLILIVITLVTSSTKSTVTQSPQSISKNYINGIGTLEQSDQKSQLWVKALIHEPQKNKFKIGQDAIVTFRTTGQQPYAGIVRRISTLNQYLPQEKMVYVTVDTLPKMVSIGEQAEILINLP